MTWDDFKAMVDKIADENGLSGETELECVNCWTTNPHGMHGDLIIGGKSFHFRLDGREVFPFNPL